jgi:tetrahydromethanopterin S-methyltransferase subunit G
MSDLDLIIQAIERHDAKLDRILVQTTKTNGRVNALEDRQSKIEKTVEELNTGANVNIGRDKVILFFISGVCIVLGFAINHIISKIK